MQKFSITLHIEAPMIYQPITIYANHYAIAVTSVSEVLENYISDLKTLENNMNTPQMICYDLLKYGEFTAKYFEVGGDTSTSSIQSSIQDAAIASITVKDTKPYALEVKNGTVENIDNIRITGLNFDCSSKCKVHIYLSGDEGVNFSNYVCQDGLNNDYTVSVTSDGRLKIVIDYYFRDFCYNDGLRLINVKEIKSGIVLSISVYPLSYAHTCLTKYNGESNSLTDICKCLGHLTENLEAYNYN